MVSRRRGSRASAKILRRGVTRAALDAAYNTSASLPDSAERLAGWTNRSTITRSRPGVTRDLPCGPLRRNRRNILRADAAAPPLLVWFRGGYRQRASKDVFSCLADGPLALGMDVAMPGWTPAPVATPTDIVVEMAAARALLRIGGFLRGPVLVAG